MLAYPRYKKIAANAIDEKMALNGSVDFCGKQQQSYICKWKLAKSFFIFFSEKSGILLKYAERLNNLQKDKNR